MVRMTGSSVLVDVEGDEGGLGSAGVVACGGACGLWDVVRVVRLRWVGGGTGGVLGGGAILVVVDAAGGGAASFATSSILTAGRSTRCCAGSNDEVVAEL